MPRKPHEPEPPDVVVLDEEDLIDIPDDLDVEDPLSHLERFVAETPAEDDEEFEEEATQPLELTDLFAGEDTGEFLEDSTDLVELDDAFISEVLVDEAPPPDAEPAATAPVVLPWQLQAELPEQGLTLPTTLDPTLEQSAWVVSEPGERDRVEVTLRLPGLEVRATLRVVTGRTPGLRLGRDVLSGRVLVSC